MENVTGQELRDLLNTLKITQREWGELMGRNARQARRWCSGENPIPQPVGIIIRWLASAPHDFALLKKIARED